MFTNTMAMELRPIEMIPFLAGVTCAQGCIHTL